MGIRVLTLGMMFALCLSAVFLPVEASSLSDLQQQQKDNQKEQSETTKDLEDAKKKTDQLQQEADDLAKEYRSLSEQLQAVADQINSTEDSIAATTEEIATLNEELAEAREKSAAQYDSMSKRIRYMYENGNNQSLLVTLLSSRSISDFVRRAEYVYSIVTYDEKKMEEYEQLLQKIRSQTETLSEKQHELSAYQEILDTRRREMDELVTGAGQDLSAKQGEVSASQMTEAEYQAKIAELAEKDKVIQKQIAEEQLRLAEEIAKEQAKQEAESGNKEDTSGALEGYTQADLILLASLIQAESDNQPYEGKLAVGSVVMNRVKSTRFPNTISGVIYQANQFAPVKDGHLALILERGPNDTCKKAARQVLEGYRNVDYLFFWAVWLADERNIYDVTEGIIIGDHYFYNYLK